MYLIEVSAKQQQRSGRQDQLHSSAPPFSSMILADTLKFFWSLACSQLPLLSILNRW
jgi:hypothetical protein